MKEKKITDEDVELLAGVVSHETNLLFIVARVLDTITADVESRMKRVNASYQIKGEVKKRLKEYTHYIEQAGVQFRNFVEPQIMDSFNEDWKQFERSRCYANELIRLLMLYYETCTKNNGNHLVVFETMEGLLGKDNLGVFSVSDINRFDLGCKERMEKTN